MLTLIPQNIFYQVHVEVSATISRWREDSSEKLRFAGILNAEKTQEMDEELNRLERINVTRSTNLVCLNEQMLSNKKKLEGLQRAKDTIMFVKPALEATLEYVRREITQVGSRDILL